MEATKSINIDRVAYIDAIEPCIETAILRNQKYGNSIDLCSDRTIMELCQMKLERNKRMVPTDPKYYDEIEDCVNYLVYLLMRRK